VHVKTENLPVLDNITAILFVISGCILFYCTYRTPEKKKFSYMGLALVFIGTVLLVFPFIFGE
jgi:peptidoglycan/LPS O-acetylase OafA/YrhL